MYTNMAREYCTPLSQQLNEVNFLIIIRQLFLIGGTEGPLTVESPVLWQVWHYG